MSSTVCAISGEASSRAMREELRRCLCELGAQGTTIFDRYGSTELGAFAQCTEEGDWHNPAPEIQFHEIVDPDTGARLPDGERGALAVTHLDRRGTVLIRFLIGDTVAIERTPCPHCGRNGDRISPLFFAAAPRLAERLCSGVFRTFVSWENCLHPRSPL